ncbi:hypothetical protein SD71_11260 [Cohnella kolymensis]|uniref:DUF1292 domain-containing protein n=1 Tax=Cohnella kolymensis TaxID=1590652 RepID=A0ABR5A4H0_9BACL|nr:DUF1292 domain-containing protein [Cohnella kolymensis]KIL35940.1 hypothetical protein SD71_11260 [Cohnella kolymensis]
MEDEKKRDLITVEDAEGKTKQLAVEALFDMNDSTYALLKSTDDIILMRVVGNEAGEQYLEGIDNEEEANSILDAYQIAIDAAPAE